LAEGLRTHIADLRKRAPKADLVVQVDEPALPAVIAGAIPTASGYGRHRSVEAPEVDRLLRLLTDAISEAGATPVVHSCASDVPVSLVAGAGFAAISFDLSLATPDDVWAATFESGVDLWPGGGDRRAIDRWFTSLGFDDSVYGDRTVITPSCGLSGWSPADARAALTSAQQAASTA
jgi:hypothetical protein